MSSELAHYTEPAVPPLTESGLALIERESVVLAKADAAGTYKGKPADIVLVGITAHTVGVPITTALSDMFVIERRVTFSARLRVGLARRAGHKVRFPETTAQACTCTLQRRGEMHVEKLRITLAEVPDVLTRKDNWKNYPMAMLRAMAARQLVNMAAQEVLLGIPNYVSDEQLEAEGIDVDDFDTDDLTESDAVDAPSMEATAADKAELRERLDELKPHQREWLYKDIVIPGTDPPRYRLCNIAKEHMQASEAAAWDAMLAAAENVPYVEATE